jgi:hypothetical protein
MTEAARCDLWRLASELIAISTGRINGDYGADTQYGDAFFYFYVHVAFLVPTTWQFRKD